MASVKKHPRSKFWTACYTLPNGERKQVSSRQEDKNKALQVALKLESASAAVVAGGDIRQWALRLVDEIVAMGGQRIVDETSIRTFFSDALAARARQVSGSTRDRYRVMTEAWFRYLGRIADEPLFLITPAVAAGFRDAMLAEGYAPKTVRNQMAWIRQCLNEAVEQQRIQDNPFKGIRPPGRPKGEGGKRAFSWEQFQALLKATEGDWRLCILIGGLTGQRQQDVAQLRWKQIDLGKGQITFERQKTDDRLIVPMHPTLFAALKDAKPKGADGNDFVMPEIAALPATTSVGFPHIFRFTILPKIGIEQPYKERGKSVGRQQSEYSFHSLRHMLSTALNSAGVSAETRMLIVGHADKRVSAGYTHAQLADAAKALERLPEV